MRGPAVATTCSLRVRLRMPICTNPHPRSQSRRITVPCDHRRPCNWSARSAWASICTTVTSARSSEKDGDRRFVLVGLTGLRSVRKQAGDHSVGHQMFAAEREQKLVA